MKGLSVPEMQKSCVHFVFFNMEMETWKEFPSVRHPYLLLPTL